jgi:hypothetical protein
MLERVGLSGLPARDVASWAALGTAARAGLVEFAPISDALPAIWWVQQTLGANDQSGGWTLCRGCVFAQYRINRGA